MISFFRAERSPVPEPLQEQLDEKEYQSFYEGPYRNEPQSPKSCEDAPWNNAPRPLPVTLKSAPENRQEPESRPCEEPPSSMTPWRTRPVSFKTALDKWRE